MGPTEASPFRPRSPNIVVRQRLVRTADLREAALIGLYGLAVHLLPPPWWPTVADAMHRARRGLRRRRQAQALDRFRSIYGEDFAPAAVRAWDRAFQQGMDRRRLYTVAERFTARWRPDIALSGAEHLAAALDQGKGALLWFDGFTHSTLVAKRALHEAGYAMHYLSSHHHGGSASAFGRTLLNPVYVAAELAYLRERIVLDDTNQVACTRRMWTILRENGIVGVTNTTSANMRFVEAPFGPSARLTMSTTVLGLAIQTGAPILPVATIETKPLQDYSVIIGPALRADRSLDRERAAPEIAAGYARWLLPVVKEHPEQWSGWKSKRMLVVTDPVRVRTVATKSS
jgi:lauroyl/myristoyl acyltransferase